VPDGKQPIREGLITAADHQPAVLLTRRKSPRQPGPGALRTGSGKAQCSVMAALETAAHPHHTEANPETVSRAMTMTATRLATPKMTTCGLIGAANPIPG
jgi:hypothetical protein